MSVAEYVSPFDFTTALTRWEERHALVWDEGVLNFTALARWVDGIAAGLRARGAKPGDTVLSTIEGGPPAIAFIMGALQAGVAFVFMKPNDPRVPVIMREAHAPFIVDAPWVNNAWNTGNRLPREDYDPALPACIYYTSGSTGGPKGVVISRLALADRLRLLQRQWNGREDDIYLSMSPPGYGSFPTRTLGPLYNGETQIVPPVSLVTNPTGEGVARYIAKHAITDVFMLPSVARRMLAACDALNIAPPQNLSVVGESPAGLWHDNVAITSIYGTTETAAHGMTIRLDRLHTDAPLGSPMPGVQAIVRNQDGSEAPDDTEGEICLGGLIADGYLNDPERTAEKFYTQNGIHYFRTGDIGVRRGREFYYLRRADLRVKIRGYCVYPEEVEEALMRSLPIMEVAVQAYPTYSGYPALCAAYTASKRIDPQAARRAAVAALPAYMVPAIFSQVESLPTGPHGKLDRNAVIPPLE